MPSTARRALARRVIGPHIEGRSANRVGSPGACSLVCAAADDRQDGWGKPKGTVDITHRKTIEDWVNESYRREDAAKEADKGELDKLQ